MHRRSLFFLVGFLPFGLLLLGATPTLADDLNPPDYRSGPLSTSAEWDFREAPASLDNIKPDGNVVPLVIGDAAPLLDAAFPVGAPHPSCAALDGLFYDGATSNGGYRSPPDATGILVCNIPNWIDMEPEKRLRLQLTYRSEPEPSTAVIGFIGVPGSSDDVDELQISRIPGFDPSLPMGMSYFYEDWKMFPNPDWEQVVIFVPPNGFIDQLVVDTISGPETPTKVVIFYDGYESGDTSRWSLTVP